MNHADFIGGVIAGAILVGAAWWGRYVAKYGPADEQDIDRLQQPKGEQHALLERVLQADIRLDLRPGDVESGPSFQGIHLSPGESITLTRPARVTITGRSRR